MSEIGSEPLCCKGLAGFKSGVPEGYEDSLVPQVRQNDEEERGHVVRQDALAVQEPGLRRLLDQSPHERRTMGLEASPRWPFSKERRTEHTLPARTPRRRNELMWGLRPPVPPVNEIHDVAHLDGIHLHRNAVVLIALPPAT